MFFNYKISAGIALNLKIDVDFLRNFEISEVVLVL